MPDSGVEQKTGPANVEVKHDSFRISPSQSLHFFPTSNVRYGSQ